MRTPAPIVVVMCVAALVVSLAHGPAAAQQLADPLKTDAGLVSGSVAGSDGKIRVYKGIPFAAPPVGDLRWKPPQPAKPWEGVRKCTEFGPSCPQPKQDVFNSTVGKMDEDCLYLNVWTPAASPDDRFPVMVWIHGGGCTTGSGSMSYYDGEKLARRGVVLVTINYRLGPLGFLAHPLLSKESEHGVSGNYGMLDQIAALQWVQRNIAAFGGNPQSVTIFGESAGSASVCRLMISPLAKGLFHRAIAESGGVHGRNRHFHETVSGMEPMEKVGERLAASLGCDKAEDPLAAMRAKTADEILAASSPSQGLFGKGDKYGWVVDGWAIPDDPAKLFAEGKYHDVPLIIGSNADEGTIFLKQLPIKRDIGYKLLMKAYFGDDAEKMLEIFPPDAEDISKSLDRFTTVSAFVYPARAIARAMSGAKSKVYLYHFTRVPAGAESLGLGAFHGLEISYVFGNPPALYGWNRYDENLSEVMSSCWVEFAATGDPNGEGLPAWLPYTAEKDEHLEFGDMVKMGSGLFAKECDALEEVMSKRQANGLEGE